MKPIVSDLVQFKSNARDTEPVADIITSVHGDKVELCIFRNGLMEQKRNVTLAENALSVEVGQCWLASSVKR